MRIGLDATPLTLSSGGIRRYTEELALALAACFPEDEFHLISDQRFKALAGAPGNLFVDSGSPLNALTRKWWTIGLAKECSRLQLDLFHGTNFSVPYLPLRPSVLTLHDLSPWLEPCWHHDAARVRRRTPGLLRLGVATMVVTPTEAVRNEAIARFGLKPERVVAVPEAASPHFQPVAPLVRKAPYFLFVGTVEPRKNLGVAVDAWRELRKSHVVDFVIAGRRREDSPEFVPQEGLHLLGEVEERELPGLYSGAVCCVYPSLYEGFGLPVLEAMQCGCALVASRDSAILEVSGGAAIHVDAKDTRGWLAAMELLLQDRAARLAQQELCLQRARQFSWGNTARLTREVYVEALGRF